MTTAELLAADEYTVGVRVWQKRNLKPAIPVVRVQAPSAQNTTLPVVSLTRTPLNNTPKPMAYSATLPRPSPNALVAVPIFAVQLPESGTELAAQLPKIEPLPTFEVVKPGVPPSADADPTAPVESVYEYDTDSEDEYENDLLNAPPDANSATTNTVEVKMASVITAAEAEAAQHAAAAAAAAAAAVTTGARHSATSSTRPTHGVSDVTAPMDGASSHVITLGKRERDHDAQQPQSTSASGEFTPPTAKRRRMDALDGAFVSRGHLENAVVHVYRKARQAGDQNRLRMARRIIQHLRVESSWPWTEGPAAK